MSTLSAVAGIDSSTQSVKVVIRDALSGRKLRESRVDHPVGTEVDPEGRVSHSLFIVHRSCL